MKVANERRHLDFSAVDDDVEVLVDVKGGALGTEGG
jgi:hypothetical protein